MNDKFLKSFYFYLLLFVIALPLCTINVTKPIILYPAIKDYVVGNPDIEGNVNVQEFLDINANFDIGADDRGKAVFKNPDKAFKVLLEDYKDGISVIQRQFNLKKLTKKNFSDYLQYGWQTSVGTQKELQEAMFVTKFLDIYQNSFH